MRVLNRPRNTTAFGPYLPGLAGAETGAGLTPSSTEWPLVVKNGQGDGGKHEDNRGPGGEPGENVGRGAGTERGL